MKPAAALVALFLSACAGSTAGPQTAVDSCAVARPDFGAATAADRDLFAYDVGAPLNLQFWFSDPANAKGFGASTSVHLVQP